MFNCMRDVDHVVQRHSTQCQREDYVPFPEEGAVGESLDVAAGLVRFLHTAQGPPGTCGHKWRVDPCFLARVQNSLAEAKSKVQGPERGIEGEIEDLLACIGGDPYDHHPPLGLRPQDEEHRSVSLP